MERLLVTHPFRVGVCMWACGLPAGRLVPAFVFVFVYVPAGCSRGSNNPCILSAFVAARWEALSRHFGTNTYARREAFPAFRLYEY